MSRAPGRDGTDDIASLAHFTWEYLRMQLSLIFRYKLNFAGRILISYLVFAMVFYGGQSVASRLGETASLGNNLNGFIVGWFLLAMVQASYASLAKAVTEEARRGTLEQLYLTPYGFRRIMLSRIVIQIFLSVLSGVVILALMLLTTGRAVSINLPTVVPIVLLTLLSAIGLGLSLAGLTLVYKKIGSLITITQFAVIGLVGAPLVESPVLRYLPVAQGSVLLQQAMTEATPLWEFPPSALLVLGGTAVGYFLVGYGVLTYCLGVARSRGVMGHY